MSSLLHKIEDKLSGNKQAKQDQALANESGVDSSRQHGTFTGEGSHLQQSSGAGTSHVPGSHATGTTGTSAVGGSSGITGGTHPAVTEHNTTHTGPGISSSHAGSGIGGTHNTSHTGAGIGETYNTSHTGTGIGGPHTSHTGTGIGGSHTGTGIEGTHNTSHTGTGIGGSHTGSGIGGTHNTSHIGTGIGQTHNTSHTGTGIGGSHTGTGVGGTHDNSHVGTGIGGTHSSSHTGTGHSHGTQHTDFVPGSHPNATNPSAIPTAGGERVGSGGDGAGVYDSHTHDNRSGMEKIKDKVIPGRTDRPDDSLTGQNYNQEAHGTSGAYGSTTGSHVPHNTHNTTGAQSSIPGSHNTHGASGLTGHHQTTSASQPLAHDSGFNERHAGAGTGAGIAGAGVTGSGPHTTHDHHQHTSTHQPTHQQYSSSEYGSQSTGGVDNRSGMEKIKDKVIPSRSDRPDDPISGQNYSQNTSGADYGSTTTRHDHGVSGVNQAGQHSHYPSQQGAVPGANHTYGSGVNDPSVGGITHGVGNTGIGGNSAYPSNTDGRI